MNLNIRDTQAHSRQGCATTYASSLFLMSKRHGINHAPDYKGPGLSSDTTVIDGPSSEATPEILQLPRWLDRYAI